MTTAYRFQHWLAAVAIGSTLLFVVVPMSQTYKRRSELLRHRDNSRGCGWISPFARRTNWISTRQWVPQPVHDWLGKARVEPLEPVIYAYLSPDSDDDVGMLAEEKELNVVWIVGDGNNCTGQLLRHLIHLPQLKDLRICNVPITSDGIALISRFPALKFLSIECSENPSLGLESLSQLTDIEVLYLMDERCPISEEVYRQIAAMPNLRILCLGTSFPTPAGLDALTQSTTIECIHFSHQRSKRHRLTLESVQQLSRMKAIKCIGFSGEIESEAQDFLKEAGLNEEEEELLGLPR